VIVVGPAEFGVFPEEKLLEFLFVHPVGSSTARISYRPGHFNFASGVVFVRCGDFSRRSARRTREQISL
jgi:hypothetical protein